MVNPNPKDSYNERILQDTRINEDLPYKEIPFPPRNGCQLYATIKTPKPSEIKIRIIYPSSDILKLGKFSDLTFGGNFAGTISVLSVGSSPSLLCKSCLEHVRTMQLTDDFRHHKSMLILCHFLGICLRFPPLPCPPKKKKILIFSFLINFECYLDVVWHRGSSRPHFSSCGS